MIMIWIYENGHHSPYLQQYFSDNFCHTEGQQEYLKKISIFWNTVEYQYNEILGTSEINLL